MNTNNNQTTNDTNNNAKGNRNGKEKKKKAKDKNLYKTVYTAQDIDGHIGDKSIDDLVYYDTGKGKMRCCSIQQPVTKLISDSGITTKSKVKDFYPTNSNVNKKILNTNNVVINSDGLRNKKRDTSANSTHVATTANQDVDANNFKELRYTASDPETVDQETSFQPVKSKHLKRRKGTSKNKPVGGGGVGGDLGMQSPQPNHQILLSSRDRKDKK
ncbi:carnosine N-methyltransferase-like [Panonychus citri]|uniref:carnosine N-methyltransferase-like n=1 Tax=Panonychus citri TaxID=50023 RepID=UPI002307A47A|nr:carnosine N-methyltransferase-like [Panonychus citri]